MNTELFLQTLPYMLKGMIGIFSVTIIIILSIYWLNFLQRPSGKNKNGKKK